MATPDADDSNEASNEPENREPQADITDSQLQDMNKGDPIGDFTDQVMHGNATSASGQETPFSALKEAMPGARRKAALLRRNDPFAYLKYGLAEMQKQLSNDPDFLTLWERLHRTIEVSRIVDWNRDRSSELNEIVSALNIISLEKTGHSYNHYCGIEESDARAQADTSTPLETLEAVEEWYFSLPELEQCLVLATFVLHGGTYIAVRRMAYQFYDAMKVPDPPVDEAGASHAAPPRLDAASRRNARTVCRKEAGVGLCIYWNDPQFALLVRRFIAQEPSALDLIAGIKSFPDHLASWAEEHSDDEGWLAARALGAIWWHQARRELFAYAQRWSRSAKVHDWEKAAALLDSAYEMEQMETRSNSEVLAKLAEWVNEGNTSRGMPLARVAAYTYSLIGHDDPTIGLDGLDRLLRITQNKTVTVSWSLSLPLFLAGTLSYAILTWSGQLRPVLARLAEHAERLSRQRLITGRIDEQARQRRRQSAQIAVVFFNFFFIAASSLTNQEDTPAYTTSGHLQKAPNFPGAFDVLLAGVLMLEEAELRQQIMTIFCALVVEGNTIAAFDHLRRWAKVVLQQTMDESAAVRAGYVRFLIDLGKLIALWEHDLIQAGARLTVSPTKAFTNHLNKWDTLYAIRHPDMSALAFDVSEGLKC